MDQSNVVIVGGGVVGCAVARAISQRWGDVFLLEQMPKLGMGASSRNSGVIHAGLYYPPGSLKARHCVAGNRMMYEFCAAHGVSHRRTGKLVVATTEEEEAALEPLLARGEANSVEGMQIVDRSAVRKREPHIEARAAILVPSSGLVASEELVKTYARLAAAQGAHILTHARVERLEPTGNLVRVYSTAGEIETRCLINAAGLFADDVAAMVGNTRYRIQPLRGEYCEVVRGKSHLVNSLVYPLPHREGLTLGVHLTKTLWGTVLVGPTAHYIEDKNDYEDHRVPVEEFYRMAKRMLPELEPGDLFATYSGNRAKLVAGATIPGDFVITPDPSVPAMIQLVGIESPGLTSSASIAEEVAGLAAEILT